MNQKNLIQDYKRIRAQTEQIVSPLKTEDFVIQPMTEVSPPKWHIGHTSWFFEKLILENHIPRYKAFDALFMEIFNSYYESLGPHWNRSNRGVLSRPTVTETFKYRTYVDQQMLNLLESNPSQEVQKLVRLGLNHEQQHHELLLMDIKNIFSAQALNPTYRPDNDDSTSTMARRSVHFEGGLVEIGHAEEDEFSYDNEGPRHKVWIAPFRFSNRLITNAEFLNFIESGGYGRPELWLSDGWSWVLAHKIEAPLYWKKIDGSWYEFTLAGLAPLNPNLPVSHISYYEAQAFARSVKMRLPTEQEWEFAAQKIAVKDQGFLIEASPHLKAATEDFSDLHGHLWQWTQSSYLPYPGHKWIEGPLGEYTSKFMVNQMVLRGGSYGTDRSHYRITYRNYFYPHERWMFSGLRLAEDV